jgi:hypothetical protein
MAESLWALVNIKPYAGRRAAAAFYGRKNKKGMKGGPFWSFFNIYKYIEKKIE